MITNNHAACDRFHKTLLVSFVEKGYIDVLYYARDEIHKGSKLITHPLMGSVKPNETPYRSIILENHNGDLDFGSLKIIEDSIEKYKSFVKDRGLPDWNEKQLEDFSVIDQDLIESALDSLNIRVY